MHCQICSNVFNVQQLNALHSCTIHVCVCARARVAIRWQQEEAKR